VEDAFYKACVADLCVMEMRTNIPMSFSETFQA
jgi:hypothetical protein